MIEDSKIIDLFFARDEQAIAMLALKYGAGCSRISRNILKNELDAEECVNDTYLAAWNSIPPEKPDPLRAYIFRIIRNISLEKYRFNTAAKRNSYYDAVLDELEGCIADPRTVECEFESMELAKHLDSFLDTLDKNSRLMFMCRYWCSDSLAEIARMFDTSEHNASVKLYRIRKKLRKYLTKVGVEV